MSAPINDGGPAFPLPVADDIDCHGRAKSGYGGMTLRDYFAGQAMTGMLADPNCTDSASALAKACYSMADSMLKARDAGAPEWTSVDQKKPNTGAKVLVLGEYSNGNSWTALARWFPLGTMDISIHYDRPDGWDGETNPRDAWWEESHNCEVTYELTGITHWTPLPKYQEGSAK